ncbi:hypothetical protein ACFL27_24595, partial [candidate division CSSED10-310 bacterium]
MISLRQAPFDLIRAWQTRHRAEGLFCNWKLNFYLDPIIRCKFNFPPQDSSPVKWGFKDLTHLKVELQT